MLVGRRSFGFADASIGSGESVSFSISASNSGAGCSGSTMNGEAGSGTVRAAEGTGDATKVASGGGSVAFCRVWMLECRRGNWKFMCAVSVEFNGVRLEKRRGGFVSIGDAGKLGDRGGISIMEALTCASFLNDDSVGV